MLNDGENNVPEKTIVIFPDEKDTEVHGDIRPHITDILKKPTKTRDWFNSHFYRCLPLVTGNQYGFVLESQFAMEIEWSGSNEPDGVKFFFEDPRAVDPTKGVVYPHISSHFGFGTITINPPFTLRTPPGVNLMTINPPNVILPNLTVLTGVVETDNLRRNFTFNLKVQIPNIRTHIPAHYPLAAFIPIPRYFADDFSLKFADEVFLPEVIEEENQAQDEFLKLRTELSKNKSPKGVDRLYYTGYDIYKNKFKDHQGIEKKDKSD